MADLLIATSRFPESADVQLANWLREQLAQRGYECDKAEQKDGFWGFWVKQQAVPIWVLVASVSDEGPVYEWGISVDPKLSLLNPKVWGKKTEGKEIAQRIMAAVKEACESDADTEIAEEADDDDYRSPLTILIGPNRPE